MASTMNEVRNSNVFMSADLGTPKPTSVPMEVVEVKMSASDILNDFAKAFVKEAYRKDPLRAQQVELTTEEVVSYTDYLLCKRIQSVNGICEDFRALKNLWIPSYVQWVLTLIGEVYDRAHGLKFTPVYEGELELNTKAANRDAYEKMLEISKKIAYFEDSVAILNDAMPRETSGNADFMSCALVAGYVRATKVVEHVAVTYAAAFANAQLKREAAFQALYRVQYDDVDFIQAAFVSQKGLV